MKATLAIIAAMLPLTAHAQQRVNPCVDPAAFARQLAQANPGANQDVLFQALIKAQEVYGCRAPPPQPTYPMTTRCAWEGFGQYREWVCRAE